MDFSNSKSAHRSLTRRGKDQLALRFEHFFSDAAADIDAASQELQLQEIQEMLVETKMEWEGAALALLLYTERIVIKIRAAVQASASDDSAAGDIALGMEGLVRQILDTATDNLLHALEHNEPRVRKLASKGIHSISSSLLVGQHAPHVLPASHAAQSGSSSSSDSSYVRQEHGEKAPCGNISSDSDSEDDDKKTATSTANTTGTKTESGLSVSASAGARASYLQSQQRRLRRKQQTAATVAHLQLHFYQRSSPLLLAAIRASILRFEKSRPAALGGVGPENSKTVPLDDTTGWGNLETSLQALHELLKAAAPGCAQRFVADSDAVDVAICQAGAHQNRYVREESLGLVRTLCDRLSDPIERGQEMHNFNSPSFTYTSASASTRTGSVVGAGGTLTSVRTLSGADIPLGKSTAAAGGAGGVGVMYGEMAVPAIRTLGGTGTLTAGAAGEGAVQRGVQMQGQGAVIGGMHSTSAAAAAVVGPESSLASSNPIQHSHKHTAANTATGNAAGNGNGGARAGLSPAAPATAAMSTAIRAGLQDDWSQIRLVATHATKALLYALRAHATHTTEESGVPQAAKADVDAEEVMAHMREQHWVQVLTTIYTRYAPEKLALGVAISPPQQPIPGSIPHIMELFRGRENYMLEQLVTKYGEDVRDIVAPLGDPPTSATLDTSTAKPRVGGTASEVFKRGLGGDSNVYKSRSADVNDGVDGVNGVNESCARYFDLVPELLPRLCLNRHFAADGVRTCSHTVWRDVMGPAGGGVSLARHIRVVVSYYTDMTRSNNHMVAEAALQGIAELSERLPPGTLGRAELALMLRALRACLRDKSWPVRDAACVCAGALLKTYGEQVYALDSESKEGQGKEEGQEEEEEDEEEEEGDGWDYEEKKQVEKALGSSLSGSTSRTIRQFFRTCARNLGDPVPSVRLKAALALASVVFAPLTNLRSAAERVIDMYIKHHLPKGDESSSAVESAVGILNDGARAGRANAAKVDLLGDPKKNITFFSPAVLAALKGNEERVKIEQEEKEQEETKGKKDVTKIDKVEKNETTDNAEDKDKKKKKPWRRGGGWGCCLDCMVVRASDEQDRACGSADLVAALMQQAKLTKSDKSDHAGAFVVRIVLGKGENRVIKGGDGGSEGDEEGGEGDIEGGALDRVWGLLATKSNRLRTSVLHSLIPALEAFPALPLSSPSESASGFNEAYMPPAPPTALSRDSARGAVDVLSPSPIPIMPIMPPIIMVGQEPERQRSEKRSSVACTHARRVLFTHAQSLGECVNSDSANLSAEAVEVARLLCHQLGLNSKNSDKRDGGVIDSIQVLLENAEYPPTAGERAAIETVLLAGVE